MLNERLCEELPMASFFRHINNYSDVKLLKVKKDMAIVRVGKHVTLLRKNGDIAILFPRKVDKFHRDWSVINFKHDYSQFETQKAFQPKIHPNITSIAS